VARSLLLERVRRYGGRLACGDPQEDCRGCAGADEAFEDDLEGDAYGKGEEDGGAADGDGVRGSVDADPGGFAVRWADQHAAVPEGLTPKKGIQYICIQVDDWQAMADRFSAMGATLDVPTDANAELEIHDLEGNLLVLSQRGWGG